MKKILNFIVIFVLFTSNIFAADEIDKGKTLLKSLSKKSLTKKETISFLKEYAIILEDERGDDEVTYVFDDKNYSRYKGIEVISTDTWRFSKLGALRLFNKDIKMSWKIKITDKENLINIKTKFDPVGKLYEFDVMNKKEFLDQIEQAKQAEIQKKEAIEKARIEKKKKQEQEKLAAEQKLEEEKRKLEEERLAVEQKLEEEKRKLEEEKLALQNEIEELKKKKADEEKLALQKEIEELKQKKANEVKVLQQSKKTPAQIKKEERERKKQEKLDAKKKAKEEKEKLKQEKLAAKKKAKEEEEKLKQEKLAAQQKAKEEEERKRQEILAEQEKLKQQKIEDEKEKKRIAEEKKILNYPSLIELIPFEVGAIEEKQLNDLKGNKIRVKKITINTIDDSTYTSLGKVSIYYMDGGAFKYLSLQCILNGDNATEYLQYSNGKIKTVQIVGTVKMYRRSFGMVLEPCEWTTR
jgi:hypothetical protein